MSDFLNRRNDIFEKNNNTDKDSHTRCLNKLIKK